jgi:Zn-dependent protease
MACCFAPVPHTLRDMLLALALFNVVLGAVNLVPVYPLDGYKLVVGVLWSVTGSERRARRILRRVAIGLAALELPAAALLLTAKPVLGAFVVTIAGCCWLVHKRLARAAAT